MNQDLVHEGDVHAQPLVRSSLRRGALGWLKRLDDRTGRTDLDRRPREPDFIQGGLFWFVHIGGALIVLGLFSSFLVILITVGQMP